MTYEEICKYVFESEKVDWILATSKKRDAELIAARQMSIYFGNLFYPRMTWSELGKIFCKDHATAMHSVKAINNAIDTNKQMRDKVKRYSDKIHLSIAGSVETVEVEQLTEHVGFINKNLDTLLSKMKIIAHAYCNLTDQKIISNEIPK
jgi:hypothetical protein